MPKRDDVHTVPNGNGWANKVDGEVVSRHRTKDNAVERGREVARENHAEHLIHNRNGQIGRRNSYGHDPMPPRDGNR